MNTAVEVENLWKSYGGRPVLKGLCFRVMQGEIFALLGINGAGKTTALECMEGLRRYDSGRLVVKGRAGIQLQTASLPAYIKPMEAVRLFAGWKKAGIDESLTAAMSLESMAKKTYASLSAGQKRRLHLVLALIGTPDIIFLDEPTAALDIEGREAFYSQTRRLKEQGKTIVLSSHDMAEVENLCDRMAILREGKIAFLGTAAELHAKMGGRHTICIQTPGGWEQHAADNIGETMLRLLTDLQERGVPVLDIKIDRGRLARDFMEIARREEQ